MLSSVRLDREDKTIKFEHLIPTKSDASNLMRKLFLTISIHEMEIIIDDALGTRLAKIDHDTNKSELKVTTLDNHLPTTTEKQKIMEEFWTWETGFGLGKKG